MNAFQTSILDQNSASALTFTEAMFDLAEYCELRGYNSFATLLLDCAVADSLLPLEDSTIITLPDWLLRLVHAAEYVYETAQSWYMSVLNSYVVHSSTLPDVLFNNAHTLGKGTPISAEAY